MYTEAFGLSESAFSITPDPHYLYLSPRHQEALAHLTYGLREGNGFVALTGEVGTGKTTLCRHVLEEIPSHIDIAMVFNPRLTAQELLATICDELNISYAAQDTSLKCLTDALNRHLLLSHSNGRRTVLMIDEAQNLSVDVLEQIRLLSNLETSRHKLLLIFLIGQPELNTLLARNDLRQLAQRITARYHLHALSLLETRQYIHHRLMVSGATRKLFTNAATSKIHRAAAGIPRVINIICERALIGAYAKEKPRVNRFIAAKAIKETVINDPHTSLRRTVIKWLPATAVLCIVLSWGIPLTLTDTTNWHEKALALTSIWKERATTNPQSAVNRIAPALGNDAIKPTALQLAVLPAAIERRALHSDVEPYETIPVNSASNKPISASPVTAKPIPAEPMSASPAVSIMLAESISAPPASHVGANPADASPVTDDPMPVANVAANPMVAVPVTASPVPATANQIPASQIPAIPTPVISTSVIPTANIDDKVSTNTAAPDPQLSNKQTTPNNPTLVITAPDKLTIDPSQRITTLIETSEQLTRAQAWRALFTLWGLSINVDANTYFNCEQEMQHGFKCVKQRGTWNNIREINRPVILQLADTHHNDRFALVTALQQHQVVIHCDNKKYYDSLTAIDPYWFGTYLFIWREPQLEQMPLRLGASGPDILWLRHQLVATSNNDVSKHLDIFDEPLHQVVKNFQKNHRLVEDGIVGRNTLFYLAITHPMPSEPTLKSATKNVLHP